MLICTNRENLSIAISKKEASECGCIEEKISAGKHFLECKMVIAINRQKSTLNIFSINDVITWHYFKKGCALKCSQSCIASHVYLTLLLAGVHIWNLHLFS
jgi:hypothetical protein